MQCQLFHRKCFQVVLYLLPAEGMLHVIKVIAVQVMLNWLLFALCCKHLKHLVLGCYPGIGVNHGYCMLLAGVNLQYTCTKSSQACRVPCILNDTKFGSCMQRASCRRLVIWHKCRVSQKLKAFTYRWLVLFHIFIWQALTRILLILFLWWQSHKQLLVWENLVCGFPFMQQFSSRIFGWPWKILKTKTKICVTSKSSTQSEHANFHVGQYAWVQAKKQK